MNDQTKTDIVTREKRRQELEATNFAHSTQGGALMQPSNGRELMDMANMMAQSGQMVRDFYRGNPGDCAGLIMICQPYGFNPFMVSWKTYKASKSADAPVSFEGQLVNAMVNMSAPVRGRLKYTYDGEGPTRRCTVTGIDRETGEEITYTSPMLKDIPVKNSPLWKADPDQQLGYYSARSWARRHFPELLLGVYTREEIEEAPMRDVTPKPGGFADLASRAKKAQEPPEPEDADVVPADEEEAVSEPESGAEDVSQDFDQVDTTTAFPGSDEWDEGVTAFKEGKPITSCPYQGEQQIDWLGGWSGAKKAQEDGE